MDANQRWSDAMKMQKDSYSYVQDNENKRVHGVNSMTNRRDEEMSHR